MLKDMIATSEFSSSTFSLNGQDRLWRPGQSVEGLIVELGIVSGALVVERNGVIVGKEDYAQSVIAPGDRIEVVHFVGGG